MNLPEQDHKCFSLQLVLGVHVLFAAFLVLINDSNF